MNQLSDVFGGGLDLIPHIEAAAIHWIRREYVMPQRVTVFQDMSGFNLRKVSEYLLPRRAQELQEATDIPTTKLLRTRRAEIGAKEVGDRYPVTDRRVTTDLEDVRADIALALSKAIGDKMEVDLINQANSTFIGGTMGGASTDYAISLPVAVQHEMLHRFGSANYGTLFHVIHPFQALTVMEKLIQFQGADAGTNLDFRNQAIRSWDVPGFAGLNIAVSQFLPRNIKWRVRIDDDAGTFRLSVAGLTTGAITVDATPATTATNIKAALDALSIGTWTVADGSGGTNNLDIEVTSPAALYVNADEELKVAVKIDDPEDLTLPGQKSKYDLITAPAGNLGTDLEGEVYGVDVQEISAVARSLFFYRPALVLDIRQQPTGHFETVNQGRTGEYSLYAKYGTGYWQPNLGLFLVTKATSPFALA